MFVDLGLNGTPGSGRILHLVSRTNGPLGPIRVLSGSGRFARAELVELAPGITEQMLNLAIDEGVRVTAQTSETNGENGTLDGSMAPPTSVFGSTEGRISQVAPNLVYIEGMQGSVPLWSEVSTASGDESFEVIK